MRQDPLNPRLRLTLTLFGLAAGLSGWLLTDVLTEMLENPRHLLFTGTLAVVFFGVLLALVGPARPGPALPAAAGVALLLAGLAAWASQRHDDVERFLALGYPFVAGGLAVAILTPFLAAALRDGKSWRDYATLFDLTWRIVVRYIAAALFTALVWALIALSDALLRLVGIALLDFVTDRAALAWALTGAVFGLALAVVHELRDYLSPRLVLQMLRLLVPVVLAVVALFLVLLPLRGFAPLAGGVSMTGTLIAIAAASVLLVTVALDGDSDREPEARWLRLSVQGLALAVPVLVAFGAWALLQRVDQYGLTPDRLMAATALLVLAGYGACHASAVVARGDWPGRIRRANIAVALAAVALSLLWLTPFFVPEAISARDQVARYLGGRMPAAELPLDRLARDWGKLGAQALAGLEAADPALAPRIAAARAGARGPAAPGAADARAELASRLYVFPDRAALPDGALASLPPEELRRWLAACDRALDEGPGCAIAVDRFDPRRADRQAIAFLRQGADHVETASFLLRDGRLERAGGIVRLGEGPGYLLPDAALRVLLSGEARVAPSGQLALHLGGIEIFPDN